MNDEYNSVAIFIIHHSSFITFLLQVSPPRTFKGESTRVSPRRLIPDMKRAEVCAMKTRRSFKRGWQFLAAAALLGAAVSAPALGPYAAAGRSQSAAGTQAGAVPKEPQQVLEAPKQARIDLSRAVKVSLPKPARGLTPAAFKTSD